MNQRAAFIPMQFVCDDVFYVHGISCSSRDSLDSERFDPLQKKLDRCDGLQTIHADNLPHFDMV